MPAEHLTSVAKKIINDLFPNRQESLNGSVANADEEEDEEAMAVDAPSAVMAAAADSAKESTQANNEASTVKCT